MKQSTSNYNPSLTRLLDGVAIQRLQQIVRRVPAADHVYQFARDLVRVMRPHQKESPEWVSEMVQWGAGPLRRHLPDSCRQSPAILHGCMHVTTNDIVAACIRFCATA